MQGGPTAAAMDLPPPLPAGASSSFQRRRAGGPSSDRITIVDKPVERKKVVLDGAIRAIPPLRKKPPGPSRPTPHGLEDDAPPQGKVGASGSARYGLQANFLRRI